MNPKERSAQLLDELTDKVSRRLNEEVRVNRTPISKVARDCGLSPSTVSKLWYRETKYPRFTTVVSLAFYLGINVQVTSNVEPLRGDRSFFGAYRTRRA